MNNSLKKEAEYYIELYNTDRTGRTSVIKDIRDGSLWIRKRIRRESIEAYSRIRNLKHKNIVYVRDIVSLEGEIFVIEEYADGKTLESVLCEKRKFKEKEAAEIMLQICDGLIFLHKLGLT
ncbi:MAG: protein kinase, partial [Eubacterium sp.]|nr:protein kinase [Eubacterium sp.]